MSSEKCIMCKSEIDDPYQFGEKITVENVTAHHLCLLLSGNLEQNGTDDEGILGFMLNDIKKEVRRARSHRCAFCLASGANISCCDKSCRKAFHLPCASKQNCRFEFCGAFESFCDRHHNIEQPKNCHESNDMCLICHQPMGEYNPIQSMPITCCNTGSWLHKYCLQKYAQTSGYFVKCPLCNDVETFRKNIRRNGVFVPDRDAAWEENSFYGFDENIEPEECVAEQCKMSQGRKYYMDENDEYLLVKCKYCSSKGVHECCLLENSEFVCDACEPLPPPKRQKIEPTDDVTGQQNDNNNNEQGIIGSSQEKSNSLSNVGPVKIKLMKPKLTSKDLEIIQMEKRKKRKSSEC